MEYKKIKKGIVYARHSSLLDGWPLLLEGCVVGLMAGSAVDNVIVGLAVALVAIALLGIPIIGFIVSLLFAGVTAWFAGQSIYTQSNRFDFAIVSGFIAGACVFALHQWHVEAVE